MDLQAFDDRFQELFTNMVEIAFEFVNDNKEEVDTVYAFGSMEKGNFFYNVFYKINGQLVEMHRVNTVSGQQYDVSPQRSMALLKLGARYLQDTAKLFREDGREVPTLMKMTYHPKTGAFNNKISYDLYYTNDPKKTAVDVFDGWYVELGGKLA